MLKFILITSLFLIFSFSYSSFAQPLEFNGNSVFYKGNSISKKDLKKVLSTNQHAYLLYKSANGFQSVGNTFQVVGVAVSTFRLVQILTNDSPNQTQNLSFLYGTPIYLIGWALKLVSKNKMEDVIHTYNEGVSGYLEKDRHLNFDIGITQNGVGFINF